METLGLQEIRTMVNPLEGLAPAVIDSGINDLEEHSNGGDTLGHPNEIAIDIGNVAFGGAGAELQYLDPSPGATAEDMGMEIDINAPTTAELLAKQQLKLQEQQARNARIIADDSLVRRYDANTQLVIPLLGPSKYGLAGASGSR